MKPAWTLVFSVLFICANATTLEVGVSRQYKNLQDAISVVKPGDSILLEAGTYTGDVRIKKLHGDQLHWIHILSVANGKSVFTGGKEAIHISSSSYIKIEGFSFEGQTENGVNVDDAAGNVSHHLIFKSCNWLGLAASDNNDALKLSGVHTFTVTQCVFKNGAAKGSFVDMVGCHQGLFEKCNFENGGANSLQMKGGSSGITVRSNRFKNGGERAVNIGGSTGQQFFRPIGTDYEAKGIHVYANIFEGGMATIAFVGAVDCVVEQNTIFKPTKWAVRILQENKDQGLMPCSNNIFRNNIVVTDAAPATAVNIGSTLYPGPLPSHQIFGITQTQQRALLLIFPWYQKQILSIVHQSLPTRTYSV